MDPGHFWFPMTAMARLFNSVHTTAKEIRLMIDPTSKISTITLEAAERHGCVIRHGYTTVKLQNRLFDQPPIEVRCLIVDRDYAMTPRYDINRDWALHNPIVNNNNSADKWWWKTYRYFMILGSDVAHKVFRAGGANGRAGGTYIQHTVFGIVYFGEAQPAEYDLKKFKRKTD